MRFFAQRNPLKRLYRISFGAAIVLSLPFIILAAWMTADAVLEYHRFVRVVAKGSPAPSFNTSIMHFYLRNSLQQSYNRLLTPTAMPENDSLPTMQMSIAPEHLAELNSDLPKSGKSKYYKAFLKYKDKSYTVKVRYMGDNYWHWSAPQKSWRIKTKKKKLLEDRRKINIKNPRTIITFNEALAQDLAKDIGLIAPSVFPIKFVKNNAYMGVHLFWEKIDESTIRSFKRMPGSVYDGDGAPPDPVTGISQLWANEKWWAKSASRNAEQKQFRGDIHTLIEGVNTTDLKEFYRYVNTFINKKSYASFLSLDNVTACMHHDYNHNNKFYFDPIIGKFEPISWDIDDWHLRNPKVDAAGNPLLNKWRMIPEFELIRQKRLYSLINNGSLSLDRILNKIDGYDQKIRPALQADRFRDSKNNQVKNSLGLTRHPLVFFTMDHYDQEVQRYKDLLKSRFTILDNYLSQSDMRYELSELGKYKLLRIVSLGTVGRKISSLVLHGTASSVQLYQDTNRNGILDTVDIPVTNCNMTNRTGKMVLSEKIFPGVKKVPWKSPAKILFGNFQLEPSPLVYDYFLTAQGGTVDSIQIESENLITGKAETTAETTLNTSLANDTASLHPWDLPVPPPPQEKVLGPGIVAIGETMIFQENIQLTILPGTTLRLAGGVSIICYGKVVAEGTTELPISFEAADPAKPWGVFALQGSGADNSKFAWCNWQDGSIASRNLINYSGMVSMHDVDNLSITHSRIGRNHIGDDGLHLAYCKNFLVDGSLFENAKSDAFDIDISTGKVLSSRFIASGNDSLDFMTSEAVVDRCYFDKSGDKGISVGEKSIIEINGSVFEQCAIGIEIKDQSVVTFKKNVIRNSPVAINLYKKNWRYNGGGKLLADTVFAINCAQTIKADKKSEVLGAAVNTSDPFLPIWNETKKMAGCCTPGKAQ